MKLSDTLCVPISEKHISERHVSERHVSYLGKNLQDVSILSRWLYTEWKDCYTDYGLNTLEKVTQYLYKENRALSDTEMPTEIPFTLVAYHNCVPVGCISATRYDLNLSRFDDYYPWVESLYVCEEHRHLGVGSMLLHAMEKELMERIGYETLYLWCVPKNEGYYRKRRWKALETLPYLEHDRIVVFTKKKERCEGAV